MNRVHRFGYYLGETFIRNFKKLKWASGNRETLDHNMPVVTGFKFKIEMPVSVIIENIFCRIIVKGNTDNIDQAIEAWKKILP